MKDLVDKKYIDQILVLIDKCDSTNEAGIPALEKELDSILGNIIAGE